MTPEEHKTFQDIRIVDIILFSSVTVLWLANIMTMFFRRRVQNKLIIAILYSIIGVIILTRLIEVITIRMY